MANPDYFDYHMKRTLRRLDDELQSKKLKPSETVALARAMDVLLDTSITYERAKKEI